MRVHAQSYGLRRIGRSFKKILYHICTRIRNWTIVRITKSYEDRMFAGQLYTTSSRALVHDVQNVQSRMHIRTLTHTFVIVYTGVQPCTCTQRGHQSLCVCTYATTMLHMQQSLCVCICINIYACVHMHQPLCVCTCASIFMLVHIRLRERTSTHCRALSKPNRHYDARWMHTCCLQTRSNMYTRP